MCLKSYVTNSNLKMGICLSMKNVKEICDILNLELNNFFRFGI